MRCRAAVAAAFCACFSLPAAAVPPSSAQLAAMAKTEEQRLGARIGIALRDSRGRVTAAWRGGERFPLTSTYKALLCAAVLQQAAAGKLDLDRLIQFDKSRLVAYSPITQHFTAPKSISLRGLCAAAVSHSDNTAANVLTSLLGGPAAITRFLRSAGDKTTRLDRYEPELNSAIWGDKRDTGTPLSVSLTLQKIVLGAVLPPPQRRALEGFMRGDKVAGALLRRSLPQGWDIADKSGAGAHGARAIIAIIWPPKPQQPFALAIYMRQTKADMAERDAAIARIGARIFSIMAEPQQR